MFSIVIPLYNKEKTILRCINSVLSQEITDFEILIVNDGSTDESLYKISIINDNRIKIFNKKNGGVSSARNYGINKAQYEFIAFLDADDEWLPDYLTSIRYLIKKYPNSGMYSTSRYEVTNDNKIVIRSKIVTEKDFIIQNYLKEPHIIQMSSICVRKSIIKIVGDFPLGIKIGEDTDFKLRVACKSKIAYLNEPKTIYYLAMENNSYSFKCNFKDIFPYWKWYIYPYKNKYTLFIHTSSKIYSAIKRVYYPKLFTNRIPGN